MRKTIKFVFTLLSIVSTVHLSAQQTSENMDRIELCKKNYNALFGGEALTGEGPDRELMDILQKYIFGEVFAVGNLDMRTRELITCTVLTAMQTLPQLKAHAGAALNAGATPVELREAVYQCAPFIGFPRTLNAVSTVNEVFAERGITLPLESQATVTEQDRAQKGAAIQQRLYGDEIAREMAQMPESSASEVARFLTEFCFGDIYTRRGLDLKTRELLALCLFVTMDADAQIGAHIKGNLRLGNSRDTIAAAFVQCLPYTGFPSVLKAFRILKNINDRNDTAMDDMTFDAQSVIFPIGQQGPAEWFTGKVYVTTLMNPTDDLHYVIGDVKFEAGARTYWHTHPIEQILLCTDGEGIYQEKGKPARRLAKGDVVVIPPHAEHWHGAAAGSRFTHVAITNFKDGGNVTWLRPVSEQEYAGSNM